MSICITGRFKIESRRLPRPRRAPSAGSAGRVERGALRVSSLVLATCIIELLEGAKFESLPFGVSSHSGNNFCAHRSWWDKKIRGARRPEMLPGTQFQIVQATRCVPFYWRRSRSASHLLPQEKDSNSGQLII